jgi:NAD(P)-dependent dehydrogenase (short-subunit alcohol dehydrogenase family)
LLTTIALAKRGWRVLATMRDLSRCERLEAAAKAAGVLERIELHALDVTDAAQIDTLAETLAAREVHALVNNAGFAMAGFADDVGDAELRSQFETNFFGAAAVTRAFLPQFRRQGAGHIVMLSSISGLMGFPGISSYCASKFALEGWAESLRFEMKPLGIQVVLVEPGSFETDIWTRGAILSAGTLDAQSSPNASRIARWRARMQTAKPKANPQVVADGIAAILENPRPRLRYVYGKDARMGLWLRRLLPFGASEWVVSKSSGMER